VHRLHWQYSQLPVRRVKSPLRLGARVHHAIRPERLHQRCALPSEVPTEAVALRRALLAYYRRQGRDLPWRRTRDPYAIWVSEIMLQQTQVETVVPRFAPFLRQFPSVEALAATEEAAVCEAWAGLGYYRRARNLHRAARQVLAEHEGKLPPTAALLGKLPGIGSYTAAALASIAFGERVAAVDGNLVRVLARLCALPGLASDVRLRGAVRKHAQALVDCSRPGEINQALMDIGATLCRPQSPRCNACPLAERCAARREGNPTRYPGKRKKAARRALRIAFAWIERDGAVLLEQRPLEGLWAGLWELPSAAGFRAQADLAARLGRPLDQQIAKVTHDLTHRRVQATVYLVAAARGRRWSLGRWWKDPLAAPLSALARKTIVEVGRYLSKEAR
jgi:A/G-specific adenine glycosylase